MVFKVYGYCLNSSFLFFLFGVFSLLFVFFGGYVVNLVVIIVVMCVGEDVDKDLVKCYWVVVIVGLVYILFGIFVGLVMILVVVMFGILIEVVVGLVFFGVFVFFIGEVMKFVEIRDSVVIIFVIIVFGISFFGVLGVFWGLLVGGVFMVLMIV